MRFLKTSALMLSGAALMFGVQSIRDVVHAAGGGVAVGNGDVNGDRKLDISDAVYLLSFLFQGGDPLKEVECPGLPVTGQTKCYGDLEGQWVEQPCEIVGCSGQDGFYKAGCPSEDRFVDNADGTVTDHCTGLIWQKDTADVNGDVKIDAADLLSWCDALAYCENLSFAGHDDWRLPNVRELQSIVDYGRFNQSIDSVFGAVSDLYWSSTTVAGFPGDAWVVVFRDGVVDPLVEKGGQGHVRAVRSGP